MKYYIFCIGGTGSRVLRSLTMCLSAGVKLNAATIVPIIIDPDVANADLTRTVKLMDDYSAIRSSLRFNSKIPNKFFATEIEKQNQNYLLQINNTNDVTFREFMSVASMSRENQAMVNMLFSQKNLESSMKVGFKGNPNIGSVVLNQIVKSKQFTDFANSFSQGDKIFIISSIFGGTGASGFPLLLKTLSTGSDFPNFALINAAPKGAVSILPYFKVQSSNESEIDSSTFISKAKAALAYYERTIQNSNQLNALYFLGDDISNIYSNNEGGALQLNQAHIIEFFAASAIIDFCNKDYQPMQNLELGLKDLKDDINFSHFYPEMTQMMRDPLTQLILMANSFRYKFDFISSERLNANNVMGIDKSFYDSAFVKYMKSYLKDYILWLGELKDNVRSLDLFEIDSNNQPFNIINKDKIRKINSLKSNYDLFYDRINAAARKMSKVETECDKFMSVFYLATQRLLKEKFNF